MGEANRRGTYIERVAKAPPRVLVVNDPLAKLDRYEMASSMFRATAAVGKIMQYLDTIPNRKRW